MRVMGASRYKDKGTKFLIYTQPPHTEIFKHPEEVWVSRSPDQIDPGPADDQMYVVMPYYKEPYSIEHIPPFRGAAYPPLQKRGEHYDDVDESVPQFAAVHMYGTLRFALDVWLGYLHDAKKFKWHFTDEMNGIPLLKRLEVIPVVEWNNAQFGYGFVEAGYGLRKGSPEKLPYWKNFDVLCHELGHAVFFAVFGTPTPVTITPGYKGYCETFGDLSAILCVLHSEKFLNYLFDETFGNLYMRNEFNRIAELSKGDELRIASNTEKMSNVADPNQPLYRLTEDDVHHLSEPLTGAFFDTLVQFYHENLLENGLIDEELASLAKLSTENNRKHLDGKISDKELDHYQRQVTDGFKEKYEQNPEGFKNALVWARDLMGQGLVKTITRKTDQDDLSPHHLTYESVLRKFRQSVLSLTDKSNNEPYLRSIDESFRWRELPGNEGKSVNSAV